MTEEAKEYYTRGLMNIEKDMIMFKTAQDQYNLSVRHKTQTRRKTILLTEACTRTDSSHIPEQEF